MVLYVVDLWFKSKCKTGAAMEKYSLTWYKPGALKDLFTPAEVQRRRGGSHHMDEGTPCGHMKGALCSLPASYLELLHESGDCRGGVDEDDAEAARGVHGGEAGEDVGAGAVAQTDHHLHAQVVKHVHQVLADLQGEVEVLPTDKPFDIS